MTRTAVPSEASRLRSGVGALATCLVLVSAFALPSCGGRVSLEEINALHRSGQHEASIPLLKEYLEAEPDSGEANFRLGEAYFQTRRPSLAIWPLLRAEEDPEWAVRAGLVGAMALIQSRNNEDAVKTATRALERDPDNIEALGLRAQARLAAVVDLELALADIERVLEIDPDNSTATQPQASLLIRLDRIDEAAEVIAKIEQDTLAGVNTGKSPAHWCLTRAIFAHEKGELGLAEQRFEQCREKYRTDAAVLREVVRFYTETERLERAEELLREELEQRPGNQIAAQDLAQRLVARGEIEESNDVLQAVVDAQAPGTAFDSLWILFEHLEAHGDFEAAAPVLARAMALNDDPRLPFRLVDVLVRGGDYTRALAVADTLEGEVYVELANGRILLEQGKPREALKRLQAGIRLWPNNAGARYYSAIAGEQLGNFDHAIAEYRDSIRAGAGDTDAGLRLAQLLTAQGDYEAALNGLNHHVRTHTSPEDETAQDAWELVVFLAGKIGRRSLLDQGVSGLSQLPGGKTRAIVLGAQARAPAGGQAAVVARLREADLDLDDPANIDVLRALVESLIAMGAFEKALKEVDAAIAGSPAGGGFQELRALVLRSSGAEIAEVELACDRAMAFDPNAARNLACRAWVEGQLGNTAAAVALYDRAALADADEPDYPFQAAALLQASGENKQAEARLRSTLIEHPYDGRAAGLLARSKVEQGVELEQALRLAKRARRFRAGPGTLDTLGWIQLERGETAAAVETLTRAAALEPGAPSVRYRLARALEAEGRGAEARAALGQALESESFPERERARADLERLSAGS